jgi:hypothetical protein
METNINTRAQIFEIIHNQMEQNNPPETNVTYNKLINMGLSQFETKQLIGQCIAVELSEIINTGKPFDANRFIRNLSNLPNEPLK